MNTNTSSGFQNLPTQVVAGGATAIQWTGNSTPTLPTGSVLVLQTDPDLPSGGSFDAQPFRVRIAGRLNVAATGTVTVGLYAGNSATLGSNQVMATALSVSITAPGSTNFFLETDLIWDSVSGKVSGMAWGVVGTAGTVANGSISAVTGITSASLLQFVAGVTFSAANAANSITVTDFSIETV